MPFPFSTILFDLDDTLADTVRARRSALRRAFAHAGITSPTADEFVRTLGGRQYKSALEELAASHGASHSIFDHYVDAYWQQEHESVVLFPGVLDALRSLHRRGARLGVITQKARAFESGGRAAGAAKELADMGIASLFSVVVGYEDVANHKPHPEPVLLALQQLKAGPRETLVVGDSFADIESAKAANCWNCIATWGHEADHPYDHLKADFVAHHPSAVLGLSRR